MESLHILTLVVLVSSVSKFVSSAEDAIIFTSAPDSITFNTCELIHSSEVADVYSAMLSYSLSKPYTWPSLGPVNPLKRPVAIFVLNVLGVGTDTQLNIQGTKFPMENQNDLDSQYDILTMRTNERFGQNTQEKPVLVKFNADDELYGPKSEYRVLFKSIPADAEGRLEKAKKDPDLEQTLRDNTFNTSHPADSILMVELETIKLLIHALESNKALIYDTVPDVYWIKLFSLHGIVKEYGAESLQAKEAVRLLEKIIAKSVPALENVYDNQVVMSVITETSMPYLMTRTVRSLLQVKTPSVSQIEVVGNYSAYDFDTDFDVAFALTAFTSVVLMLTVFGVSVAIWFMDPGRDSIIYRMTSQRKKD